MHKKTAPLFVHYGEPEKIKKSFAFNVDIFTGFDKGKLLFTNRDKSVKLVKDVKINQRSVYGTICD